MVKKKLFLKKTIISVVSLMMIFANVLPSYAISNVSSTAEETVKENLALNKKTYVSSCGEEYLSENKAVDGDRTSSRWASKHNDDEFITVDLGEPKTFNEVVIYWEGAFASEYVIQVSDNNTEFKDVVTVNGKEGEVATTFDSVTARYVRMKGIKRATSYGYSIYEFEVYNNVDTTVDKTILKQKLDEYRDFNTDARTFIHKLEAAVTAGDIVYNNAKATQEEVNDAIAELDRCYWMVKADDLRSKYAPLQNNGDRYDGYLTESVIPVMKVYMSAGTGLNANESQTYYETYYHDLEKAGSQLVKAPENPEKVMVGIEKYCHQNGTKEAGKFTIKEEWLNSSKIRLTVTFENTGIHPITGKEKIKFTADELKSSNLGITIKFQGGTKAIYTKEPLNGSYDNGIVFTYDVEPGWYTFYLKSGSSYSDMPGRYYTSKTPSQAPKAIVEYSTTEKTTDPVKVTLKFDKEVQDINGWTTTDHLTFTKSYKKNVTEAVTYTDLDGNEGTANISITNIWPAKERTTPRDGKMVVKFNEPVVIEDPNWKISDYEIDDHDGTYWVGTLTEDKIYTIPMKDKLGHEGTFTVDYELPKLESVDYLRTEEGVKVTIRFDRSVALTNSTNNPGWEETWEGEYANREFTKIFKEDAVEHVRFHRSLNYRFVIVDVNVTSVDKTKLQGMYDLAKEVKYDHVTNSPRIVDNYKNAMAKAKEVLASTQVTQAEVDAATTELENRYYILHLEEYIYVYSPAKEYFDYNGYTTESVVPLYRAYKETGNYKWERSTEDCKTLIKGFEDALKLLVEAPETPRGINIGINKDANSNLTKLSGQFIMTDSVIQNEDGTQSMVLHVEYKNDGINQLTGKPASKWRLIDLKKANLRLSYETYDGKAGSYYVEEFIKNVTNDGFIADIPLKYGPGKYTTVLKYGSNFTYSHGVYFTNDNLVDKSELLAFYDNYAKDFTSDNWAFKTLKFAEVRNDAKKVLDDLTVTQETVDKMLVKLKYKYYSVKVAELNTKYSPNTIKDGVNLKEYTTESLIPVINMWGITHNRININYFESGNTIGQMENWYNQYLEAEKGLKQTTDNDIMFGINQKATTTDKYQGEFKVVSTTKEFVDGKIKTKVVVEFHNTGKHPIYGSELPNANGSTKFIKYNLSPSTLKNVSFNYYGYKNNGESWSSKGNVKNLTYSKDDYAIIRGEFYVDNDIQGVTFGFDGPTSTDKETYSPWFYRFAFETEVPEVEVEYSTKALTNQDVKVILKFNEAVQDIEGWTTEDHVTFTKTYSENATETVNFKDLAGNAGSVEVKVENIDKTIPVIEGIENGAITSQDVTLTVTEDNLDKITVNGKEVTKDDLTFTEDGEYTVVVTDKAGNSSKVAFTIDKTAAEIEGIENGAYTNEDVTLTITDDVDKIIVNGKEVTKDALTFTENGEYTVVVIDKAGNRSELTFTIDKTAPVIEGIENGAITSQDVTLTVTEDNLDKITVNGKEVTKDELTFTENGKYTVVVIDKAGNRSELTFTIDKTAPVIEGIENGAITSQDVTLTVTEDNLDKITVNGKEVTKDALTFTEDGKYTIVVTDKAGNNASVTFTIQKIQNPVNPIIPTNPVVPVAPQRPTRPVNQNNVQERPTEEIEDNETPTTDAPNEVVDDNETPKASSQENRISMTTTCFMFLFLLLLIIAYYCYKKMKEKNERNA